MSKKIGDLYYILNNDNDNKTATVTFSTARSGDPDNYPNLIDKDITIPPEITIQNESIPYIVTSIGNNAFNSSKIKSIVIPKSVTSIGDGAFSSSDLTTIIFEPDSSLKTIGINAFIYSKIKSIVIPKSVTSIGNIAFDNSSLKSITFEGSKPDFGKNVFNKIGNVFNLSFGYIDEKDNSWIGTNYINDLIIRNTLSYSKSIISIIICLILLFMLYTSNISVGYKYSLYIIIIISSLIFNKNFNTTFLFGNQDYKSIFPSIIHIILSFLLFFIALLPMYSLLKILLFGFFGLIYFIIILMLTFPALLFRYLG
jgi:hypothetical protein